MSIPGSGLLPMRIPTNAIVSNLTPRFGPEIRGVSLVTLDVEDRDQLALYVARKGVIGFRARTVS